MHPYRPRSARYALANLAVALSVTFGLALILFSGVIGASQARTAAIGAALAIGVPIFAWNPSTRRAAIALAAAAIAAIAAAIVFSI